MIQIPPAEPNEANAIETFARLSTTNSQTSVDQTSNGPPIPNSHNNNKYNSSPNSYFYQATNPTLSYINLA